MMILQGKRENERRANLKVARLERKKLNEVKAHLSKFKIPVIIAKESHLFPSRTQ